MRLNILHKIFKDMIQSFYTKFFESINKMELVNTDGLSYKDFKKTLEPDYVEVWRDILMGIIALVITVVGIFVLSNTLPIYLSIPLSLICAPLIGYWVAYIQLFFHEAAHYNIAKDKKLNDKLANMFIGIWVGMDIESYRVTHWDHHRYLGTTQDTEHSYFDPLNIQFVVESLIGIRVAKVLLSRQKHISKKPDKKHSIIGPMLVAGVIFHGLIVTVPLFWGFWIFSFCWILGMLVFFPFFASVRQVLEHRDSESTGAIDYYTIDHGAYNRIFGDGLLASTLGGAGFNRHLLHHWDPQLSYTCLKKLEKYLLMTHLRESLLDSRTTYIKTFLKLLKQK